MIFIGDGKELVLVVRKPRGKLYHIVCFGRKKHYRTDGTCKHTDDVFARVKPDLQARLRIKPFGGKAPKP